MALCAAELSTTTPRPDPVAPNLSARAEVLKAKGYLATGEYSKAEGSLRAALASAETVEAARTVRNALADLLREEGRLAEARPIYSDVLASTDASPRQKFDALMGVADIDGLTGSRETSTDEWNKAIALGHEMKTPALEADALRGLGMTWLDASNPSRAEPILRRALSMMQDSDAPQTAVAATLACLGRCYRMQNKLALAEDSLTHALDLERKAFGEGHPQVAYIMERLAEVYALRHQFALARDYSNKALHVMRASCGENSGAVVAALVNRASVEQHAQALEAAADNYAAALKIIQGNPGVKSQNPTLEMQIIERYAAVLKMIHRDREAKELSAQAKSFRNNLK
jgi:tetratricopeptide (TPR) repeat protein